MKPIVISGLKPSGILHIGNYLGVIKPAVEMQNSDKYDCLYFIADYHSLTLKYDPKEKSSEIFSLLLDALASGLDPKKSTIFIQSHIPEHANLTWIFNTITSMGDLQRMVEYKEKLNEGQVPNAGLFDYPVLMAADILLYKAKFVPVGEDQRQHLELAREIARTFNSRFGRIFPEPEAIVTRALRIMSLSDPTKKMSKSITSGCVYLSDPPKVIREKITSAVTDSQKEIGYEPEKRPAVSNLVTIFSEFSSQTPNQVVARFKGAGYKEFKSELAELIVDSLKEIQAKKSVLEKDRSRVLKLIDQGDKKAGKIAEANFSEIRKRVGLI
ncbi:MAG TPA: tryptophan--tRNA ligase [Candidatus Tyrphobacter sp.]|nr:tryptophan--tRNA ligase [Candidatus Tyrphobacter sp.]